MFSTGLTRIADRLIVDQEIAGSNPAPSTSPLGQYFLSTSVDSTDKKNFQGRPLACTQCGYCCRKEVCLIGELLFDTTTPPCNALLHVDDKYWCGAVLCGDDVLPGTSQYLATALGISRGCDGGGPHEH